MGTTASYLAAMVHDVAGPAVIAFVMFGDSCWPLGALEGRVMLGVELR